MTNFGTPEPREVHDVLLFNLAHDVLVKFKNDGSATLEHFDKEGPAIRLDQKAQLLLMDAICHQWSLPSPIKSIVSHHEVKTGPDAEDERQTDVAMLPSLDNITTQETLDD